MIRRKKDEKQLAFIAKTTSRTSHSFFRYKRIGINDSNYRVTCLNCMKVWTRVNELASAKRCPGSEPRSQRLHAARPVWLRSRRLGTKSAVQMAQLWGLKVNDLKVLEQPEWKAKRLPRLPRKFLGASYHMETRSHPRRYSPTSRSAGTVACCSLRLSQLSKPEQSV